MRAAGRWGPLTLERMGLSFAIPFRMRVLSPHPTYVWWCGVFKRARMWRARAANRRKCVARAQGRALLARGLRPKFVVESGLANFRAVSQLADRSPRCHGSLY